MVLGGRLERQDVEVGDDGPELRALEVQGGVDGVAGGGMVGAQREVRCGRVAAVEAPAEHARGGAGARGAQQRGQLRGRDGLALGRMCHVAASAGRANGVPSALESCWRVEGRTSTGPPSSQRPERSSHASNSGAGRNPKSRRTDATSW